MSTLVFSFVGCRSLRSLRWHATKIRGVASGRSHVAFDSRNQWILTIDASVDCWLCLVGEIADNCSWKQMKMNERWKDLLFWWTPAIYLSTSTYYYLRWIEHQCGVPRGIMSQIGILLGDIERKTGGISRLHHRLSWPFDSPDIQRSPWRWMIIASYTVILKIGDSGSNCKETYL